MIRPASLNVMERDADPVLESLLPRTASIERVDSFDDMRALLERRRFAAPLSLDLIGHSTGGAHLLRLARTVIDMCDPCVARFFERLADDRILERAGVVAVRLLGCETATMPGGQFTMRRLSSVLRRPVFGTSKPIGRCHYDTAGFAPAFRHLLVEAGAVPRRIATGSDRRAA
jgi:hypothetical protein